MNVFCIINYTYACFCATEWPVEIPNRQLHTYSIHTVSVCSVFSPNFQ